MAKVIRFHATGGPEVLQQEELEVGEPGPGQVRLRHEAVASILPTSISAPVCIPRPCPRA